MKSNQADLLKTGDRYRAPDDATPNFRKNQNCELFNAKIFIRKGRDGSYPFKAKTPILKVKRPDHSRACSHLYLDAAL